MFSYKVGLRVKLKRQRKRVCAFPSFTPRKQLTTENLMGTYKSVLQIRCSGNLLATETIVTVKFRSLLTGGVPGVQMVLSL